ncbi:MAG: GGDEF domain-containing protein [Lachnospiraceae bacterium]|nr:GGDEF domain-containing protein [Lachnospiraceae bacterium]
MQKIFRKYTILIVTAAILLLLVFNSFFLYFSIRSQQTETFLTKIHQIYTMQESSVSELDDINQSMGDEYLTCAKAAAYMFQKNPELLTDPLELQKITELLGIDELNITDANGIVVYSSTPEYIGIDFHANEQTQLFLSILEGGKDAYVIQSARSNYSSGKIMKYVGAARLDQNGIVQVGVTPTRLFAAQRKSFYSNILSSLATDVGEEFFAIDCNTNMVLGHTTKDEDKTVAHSLSTSKLKQCTKGAFVQTDKQEVLFIVSQQYDNILICASLPVTLLYKEFCLNFLPTFLCLILVEIIILLLLNHLVKRLVIQGIHSILFSLSQITNGNLEATVEVGGNPEFEELSRGINTMVHSILHTTDRITKIIKMSDIPLAAFEYQTETNHLFVTSGLRKMLNFPKDEMEQLFAHPAHFYQRIQLLMKNPVHGEKDTYKLENNTYVRIHLALEPSGYLGVITDASKDMQEKQRMLYENTHDQLTGLYRYQYFKEEATLLINNMHPGKLCACIMLDLDSFKQINDTYGHDIGDKYLQHFASIMKKMPEKKCIVARRSGDEFCMFTYYYSDRESIRQFVQSFFDLLKENPFEFPGNESRPIKASGGFAWSAHSDIDIDLLLKYADEALYESKRNHKGIFMEYHS